MTHERHWMTTKAPLENVVLGYIPNIKAVRVPISEKKSFEVCFLCSSVRLSVSKKKNFEVCLLCFSVRTCDPWGGASFDPRGII